MASSGNLVREILREATVPASRPIDHARRIGTALFLGAIGGAMLGVFTMRAVPPFSKIVFALLGLLGFGVLCLLPWLGKSRIKSSSIPVVARVLGTRESLAMRRSKGGGLLVPVVCRPCLTTDDSASVQKGRDQDFRAVVVIHNMDSQELIDPPVGTLLPLMQVEPGMGDLVDMAGEDATPAQREMMAHLEAHPQSMRNRAPVVPLRRGSLERVPGWAALEFWLSALVGAVAFAWATSTFFA